MSEPCGCRADSGEPSIHLTNPIIFCPLHARAERVLEAGKRLRDVAERFSYENLREIPVVGTAFLLREASAAFDAAVEGRDE